MNISEIWPKTRLVSTISAIGIVALFIATCTGENTYVNKPVLTIVALGDSLTYSRMSPLGSTYCDLLENELNKALKDRAEVVVVNGGVSGDTAEGALSRIQFDVYAHQPDMVLIEFGGNDIQKLDPDWFAKNLQEVVANIIKTSGAEVVLFTGPYLDEKINLLGKDSFFEGYGGINQYMQEEINAKIRHIAERKKLALFDLYKVMAKAVGKNGKNSKKYLNQEDGVHWTAEGNKLIAQKVTKSICPALCKLAEKKRQYPSASTAADKVQIIPEPKRLKMTGGMVNHINRITLVEAPESAEKGLARFTRKMHETGVNLSRQKQTDAYELIIQEAKMEAFLPILDVPEFAREQSYRLSFYPGSARLEASGEAGFRYGLITLGQLIKQTREKVVPAVMITDWPSLRYRGVFMEDKWGTDLMTLDDWKEVLDNYVDLKMNVMGVGLYGCWLMQYHKQLTEFLMVPIKGHPEINSKRKCLWYSPQAGQWQEMEYLPKMFEGDFFDELAAYGKENGVHVLPFVNSLGHNTLIPRMIPEISAKDEKGAATGYGYCLSNPQTWEFITSFYGDIIDRYLLPNGQDSFHIQMDEVIAWYAIDVNDPKRQVDPICKCPECVKRPFGEQISDYVVRLVEFIVSKGIKNVVMYNDQLTRYMDLLNEDFVKRLKDKGIFDNLVIHYWWYDNEGIHESCHPNIGHGLRAWVGPMTCYYNWTRYNQLHQNIANMLAMGYAEGAEGALSYSVYDAGCNFEYMLLGEYAWDERGPGSINEALEKFAQNKAGIYAENLKEAIEAMDSVACAGPFDANGLPKRAGNYWYTYTRGDRPHPRQYPLEAIQSFTEPGWSIPQARSRLAKLEAQAKRARMLLEQIPKKFADETVKNLIGEAARFEAIGRTYQGLLRIQSECQLLAEAKKNKQIWVPEGADKTAVANAKYLAKWFAGQMAILEEAKPEYMKPSCMRDLSVMYEFLLQLSNDLEEATAGKRDWDKVRWHVENNVGVRDSL